MKAQTAFVRTQSGVELYAISRMHAGLAAVAHIDDAKHHRALGRQNAL